MATAIDPDGPTPTADSPAVQPMVLSHGTLGCIDLSESKRFYTEFLGLDCVRHRQESMKLRKGGYWVVVVREIGKGVQDTKTYNHWGLDVETREQVDEAHRRALQFQEKYGIRRVNKVQSHHDDYGFKLMDRDGNWWEIQCTETPMKNDGHFERGDVIPT